MFPTVLQAIRVLQHSGITADSIIKAIATLEDVLLLPAKMWQQ
jgi:hypothetical protein